MSRRVLVTGGAGFIGSHLVERLVSDGLEVTVTDDLSTGSRGNLTPVLDRVRLIVASVAAAIEQGLVDVTAFEAIFHLAANPYIPPSVAEPRMDYRRNLATTFDLLEAMRIRGSKARLINASSAAVYGNPVRVPIHEDDPTVPISPYGVSKLAAERYVRVYAELYGLRTSSVRLFSVYGPRQTKQVVFDLIQKVRAVPDTLEILGDGTQTRDMVYVADVVQAFCRVHDVAPAKGEVFNVATGTSYSIRELAEEVLRVTGGKHRMAFTGSVRPGDADRWQVDASRLAALGFKPQTDLAQGLAAVLAWLEEGEL